MMIRFALASLLVGCAAEPVVDYPFCADQHADGDVVVCDRAFDDSPRVHLPPDDDHTVYAAFGLVLRDGRHVVLVDDAGEIDFPADRDASRVPAAFAWPSYEFLERVYRITGHQQTRPDGTLEIHAPEVDVVLRIAPEVIDGSLLGTWEGTLSRRLAKDSYDGDARVPIRVTFDRLGTERHPILRWTGQADEELTYSLGVVGTIANATTDVTLADGSCAPALTSLDTANPRYDAPDQASVELMRAVGMHVPGDTQLLFNGWMGDMAMATPGALIQTTPQGAYVKYGAVPHGTPRGEFLADFARVTTGGEPCNKRLRSPVSW